MRLAFILASLCAAIVTSTSTSYATPNTTTNANGTYIISNEIFPVKDENKVERVRELLTEFVGNVKANEPGVVLYEVTYIEAKKKFLTYEVYDSYAIWLQHLKTAYLVELLKTVVQEQLYRKLNDISVVQEVAVYLRDTVNPTA